MEQDLRDELRRADAEAAKEKTTREEARAAREHAARVGEQNKAVLAKATTLETKCNVGGCVGIEGADTGNKNYNPVPVEERFDVEWVGHTTTKTILFREPLEWNGTGATTNQSGEDYNNKLHPPPKRDRECMTCALRSYFPQVENNVKG